MNTLHQSPSFPHSRTRRDPFEAKYGAPLPLGLRDEAAGMSWDMFDQMYAPRRGRYRLLDWRLHHLGSGKAVFEAMLSVDGAAHSSTAVASGPIAAITGMLYELGCNIEIIGLHQRKIGDRTATFLHAERDEQRAWSMAIAADPVASSLHAIVAAANRLAPQA
ncbi:2-isopropylmalate synthase [Hoyosella sp. YIM 151337]|uniref:alpha-isopropylmalate synthase regulatory domain-containing protein n=1 Tax=Hoyosella sp. YIM 151337 TaxID=2992742 RepID=UPI002235FC44|nr:alpha-isopropylmalate synthase regulatory domain-containing protein [Hoyosella sp. YIM 151337]MCW4352535.1 2-isopropylmalate synthase [Hoyosella sp. YIM 151337]